MAMNQQQPQQSSPDMQSALGWTVFVSRIGAVSVEVFLRRGFGQRYFGLQALLVLLLIPLWSSCCPEQDPRPLMTFLAAYVVMLLVARVGIFCRWIRGTSPHSYYAGEPLVGRLLPWLPERAVKRFVEPLVVFAGGFYLCEFSAPLGKYLMFAAGCLLVTAWLNDLWLRKRSLDVRDAMIEQQEVMRHVQRPSRW
jgi:hypothetical protein